jgi:hypothetical protein
VQKPSQVLIYALTGEVGTRIKMSGYPTNLALLQGCRNPAGIDGKWEITSYKRTYQG